MSQSTTPKLLHPLPALLQHLRTTLKIPTSNCAIYIETEKLITLQNDKEQSKREEEEDQAALDKFLFNEYCRLGLFARPIVRKLEAWTHDALYPDEYLIERRPEVRSTHRSFPGSSEGERTYVAESIQEQSVSEARILRSDRRNQRMPGVFLQS